MVACPAWLGFQKRMAGGGGIWCSVSQPPRPQSPVSCPPSLKRPAAAFVINSVCPGFGNDHRTRLRDLEHVERGSAACRAAVLEAGMVPHPLAAVAAADAADREWRHQARLNGVSELAGPPAIVRPAPDPIGP